MRHKGMRIGLVTVGLVVGLAMTAQATLIGDSVDIRFNITNVSFDENASTTVTADASDVITLNDGSPSIFSIDPFDTGFVISFVHTTGIQIRNSSFIFSDLQWQGLSGEITGVNITQDWLIFQGTTSFTPDSVTITFPGANSVVLNGQILTVNLETSQSAVPAPSAMLLMGSGLAGLVAWRWRRERKPTIQ